MAKLSALISKVAEVTGLPRPTVQEVSRRLREDGLIKTGAHGRFGGADMSPADAGSLLTAILVVNASPTVSFSKIARLTRSHLAIRSYGSGSDDTVFLDRWNQQLELPQLCRLSRGHSFGEALAALITSITNGDF